MDRARFTCAVHGSTYPERSGIYSATVDVGGIKLARGMKPIWFSEKELRKQGKIPVGQPIRFPVDGCVEKAISRKMSKLIFLDFLETNAYRILNIERYEDGSCFITIQPYNVKK